MEAEAEMAAYSGSTSIIEQFAQMETDEAISQLAELKKSSSKKAPTKAECVSRTSPCRASRDARFPTGDPDTWIQSPKLVIGEPQKL